MYSLTETRLSINPIPDILTMDDITTSFLIRYILTTDAIITTFTIISVLIMHGITTAFVIKYTKSVIGSIFTYIFII